jgi:GTP-binding protein
VVAIYEYLAAQRAGEQRALDARDAQMQEQARSIASIDPDDPRFKA